MAKPGTNKVTGVQTCALPIYPVKQKRQYAEEAKIRAAKNVDHRDCVSKWRSVMRKLDNELAAEAEKNKKVLKVFTKDREQ